jgi:hypothetical protein
MPKSFALPPGSRPPVLHWPVVAAAGALALLLVGGVTLLAARSPRPAPQPPEPNLPVAVVANLPDKPVPPEPAVVRPEPASPEVTATSPPAAAPPTPVAVTPVAVPAPPARSEKPKARAIVQETAAPRHETPAPEARPQRFKHRRPQAVDDLCRQLLKVPELELDDVPGSSGKVLAAARGRHGQGPHTVPDLFVKRSDLGGLPLRMGLECQLGKESAENLQVLSRKLRTYLSGSVPHDGIDTRPDATVLRRMLLEGPDAARHDWEQVEAVPTLTQLLQAEDKPLRLLLVELLSRIKGRAATQALVQRALFDLSEEVREAAVAVLAERPGDEFRTELLAGFRYPWAPVADHAAEALVALRDRAALPGLVQVLDEADPALATVPPSPEGKPATPVVREVVRVNHLKNCLMCHAPSLDTTEPVRGLVPTPGQPLPPTFSPAYYVAATGTFVRADITYLKQDFSVPQPVAQPGAWPCSQRFDYLVRLRPAKLVELIERIRPPETYPQREAVLFALRELTGRDARPTAADWRLVLASAAGAGTMESGH